MILPLLLAGCATTETGRFFQEAQTPEPGFSLLYVFRVSSFAGGLYVARMSLDGESTGNVGSGEYFVRKLLAGEHLLKVEKSFLETGKEHEIVITATPGSVHYVQYIVEPGEVIFTGATAIGLTYDDLILVPELNAVRALRGLKEVQ